MKRKWSHLFCSVVLCLLLGVGLLSQASASPTSSVDDIDWLLELSDTLEEINELIQELAKTLQQNLQADVTSNQMSGLNSIIELSELQQELHGYQAQYLAAMRMELQATSSGASDQQSPDVCERTSLVVPAPDNLMEYRSQIGETFPFEVTASSAGTVWGTDIYTAESHLPTAVIHAGLLAEGETGLVYVTILPGQNEYTSTTQYGIRSHPYGSCSGSYTVSKTHPASETHPEESMSSQNQDVIADAPRIRYQVGNADFYMRQAPAATFPIHINDSRQSRVDQPFWIAETEVTYHLWYTVREWALRNGYTLSLPGREGAIQGEPMEATPPTDRRDHPVTTIDWWSAMVWCNALSEYLGYVPVYVDNNEVVRSAEVLMHSGRMPRSQAGADGFRLLTTEKWELAARYQGETPQPGGVFLDGYYWTPGDYASGAYASVTDVEASSEVAWRDSSGTNPVGLLRPNALGLYDMSGNVYEWCSSRLVGAQGIRGGSFFAPTFHIGNPGPTAPTHTALHHIGFRIGRSLTREERDSNTR